MMERNIFGDKKEMGKAGAAQASEILQKTIKEKGQSNIILATGASQFEILSSLTEDNSIDWSKVVMFHLDEYIDLPETHPASFRKYLQERFIIKVGQLKAVHLIYGEASSAEKECQRLNDIIRKHPIDLALVGIGENGHLAFNDPPADFKTEEPYIVVDLEEACRKQQMGEGWFKQLKDVPQKAISMSIQQIMKSRKIICSVPDQRKAEAVKDCLEGIVTNLHPASILQNHPDCTIYLDEDSASLLSSSSSN
ncbi:glucosamine-6-phosphate deaminase [soil metagenome]